MRFFGPVSFHQTTFPGPKRHTQEQFQIFLSISGVISIGNQLSRDEYTEESI
jgi:hypothetical protein